MLVMWWVHVAAAVQGEYCLQVKMDLIPGSGIAAVGAQQVRVPAQAQSITRQVRHDRMWGDSLLSCGRIGRKALTCSYATYRAG